MADQAPETLVPTPYYSDEFVTLYHGKAEDVLPSVLSAICERCISENTGALGGTA